MAILQSDVYDPCVTNTMIDGRKAYLMPDVLSEHPMRKGLWKVVGRHDDMIALSTGQKTHPVPLEGILSADPRVKAAVFFGAGRPFCGLILEPAEPLDTSEEADVFLGQTWSTVERMNKNAPAHSRIFKHMVIIATTKKPLIYTVKGVPRRHEILKLYAEQIDDVYEAAENDAHLGVKEPDEWDIYEALDFVRRVVVATINPNSEIRDESDLFEAGCTSLEATLIRNVLVRAVRRSHPSIAQSLPPTFVYSHPTIASLSSFISGSISSHGNRATISNAGKSSESNLLRILAQYSKELPSVPRSQAVREACSDTVLITGSTGSLGIVILAHESLIERSNEASLCIYKAACI